MLALTKSTNENVTMVIVCDGTASMQSCVERMKEVMNIVSAIVQHGNTGWIVHMVVMSMRDWSEGADLITVYTNKEETLKAGRIIPLVVDGALEQSQQLEDAFQAAMKECYGGGDYCEEYAVGYDLTRRFFESQRVQHGNHPCVLISIIDDAQHGFNDFHKHAYSHCNQIDNSPSGTMHLIGKEHPLAPNGYWMPVDLTSTLNELLSNDIFTIFCLCGRAATACDEWLNYLTVLMDSHEGGGFVFTMDENDTQVSAQLATLILYNVTMFYTPQKNEHPDQRIIDCSTRANEILREAAKYREELNKASADIDMLISGVNKLACLADPAITSTTRSLCVQCRNDKDIIPKLRSLSDNTNAPIISKPHNITDNKRSCFEVDSNYRSLNMSTSNEHTDYPVYRSLSIVPKYRSSTKRELETEQSNFDRIASIASMFKAHATPS